MSLPLSTVGLPQVIALSEFPALKDSLIYQFNGLIVVFTALSLIWLLLEVMGLFFKRPASVVVVPVVAPVSAGVDDGLPADLVAAIAAAVHVSVGEGSTITNIVPVEIATVDWAREGRRQIHSARKVR